MGTNGGSLSVVEKNDLIIKGQRPLTVDEVVVRSKLVHDIVAKVMEKGKHYDKILGCGKKACLLQAGAQQLGLTFNFESDPNIINLVDTSDEYSVTVKTSLYSNGECVTSALGECSSMEEKYHWRRVVCQEEFDEAPDSKRRLKWKKGWDNEPAKKEQQVMVNPKDVANTVLKMAVKRAFVAAIINATAASDQFTQDIEDMQRELLQEEREERGQVEQPQAQVKDEPKGKRGRPSKTEQAAAGDSNGKLIAAFSQIGVTTEMIESKLGHPIAQATVEEIGYLRQVWQTIKEEGSTWEKYFEQAEKQEPKPVIDIPAAPAPVEAAPRAEPVEAPKTTEHPVVPEPPKTQIETPKQSDAKSQTVNDAYERTKANGRNIILNKLSAHFGGDVTRINDFLRVSLPASEIQPDMDNLIMFSLSHLKDIHSKVKTLTGK